MQIITLLQNNPVLLYPVVFIFGLLIGSFLNVVIHRLPIIMEKEWLQQCKESLGEESINTNEIYNLIVPRSQCPHCHHRITALENIPLLSYLFLGGKCSNCKSKISIQYPLVELFTAILSVFVIYYFDLTITALAALSLTWALIALSMIDFKHMLLPDSITLPFIWLGLLLSLTGVTVSPQESILGAVFGYLILWLVYHVFRLATGKEGMGYGDFKLLACIGAWLGWQALPGVIILSSLVGTIIGVSMILLLKHDKRVPIPFGPYLAIAGWIYLIWGDTITYYYWQWLSA